MYVLLLCTVAFSLCSTHTLVYYCKGSSVFGDLRDLVCLLTNFLKLSYKGIGFIMVFPYLLFLLTLLHFS